MKQGQVWGRRSAGLTDNLREQSKSWLGPCLQNISKTDRQLWTAASGADQRHALDDARAGAAIGIKTNWNQDDEQVEDRK